MGGLLHLGVALLVADLVYGALVGGASLKAEEFSKLIAAAGAS